MTQQPDPADTPPALPALKIPEPEVNTKEPWHDDVLDRKEIADRLTTIVREQEVPFVISVDGRWGTGKTFLLKRWQRDLEKQGFRAIYFNAWEDDFNDDPLLSITGQLSEHFDKTSFAKSVRGLVSLVPPLLDVAASLTPFGHIWVWLRAVTGKLRRKPILPESMRRHLERRATTDDFRQGLGKLGAEVRKGSGQPLVFIIDELDRCRPTFAIELLERVKHIFDVPNIVFVFGINRGELVKSLESIYGEIDAGTYLRRFFDMEFLLPDASPLAFCRSLVPKYGLDIFFDDLSQRARKSHSSELSMIVDSMAVVMGSLGLELRDIDYCVRLLSLAAKDLAEGETLNPPLFALLAAIKIENPDLYRRFVEGNAGAAAIIDHVNARHERGGDILRDGSDPSRPEWPFLRDAEMMARVEAAAYMADDPNAVRKQLLHLLEGRPLDEPQCLASATANLDPSVEEKRIRRLMNFVSEWSGDDERSPERVRSDIAKRIDLYAGFVSR